MKTITKILLFVLVSPAISVKANASFSSDYAGTSSGQFLKIGPSPRANGMGSAFTAITDDSSSIYWNPAGLLNVKTKEISFTHASVFEDINYDWLGYSNATKWGAIGIGLQYLNYDDITTRDTSGATTGKITPKDMVATLSLAKEIRSLFLGINIKYIYSKIDNSATALALDIGTQYKRLLDKKIKIGFVAQNLGTKIKYSDISETLPVTFKLGAGYEMTNNLILSADIGFPKDAQSYTAVGGEYSRSFGENIKGAIRAGYNTISKDLKSSGFSAGFGISYKSMKFDYSYSSMGDLDGINRFGISLDF